MCRVSQVRQVVVPFARVRQRAALERNFRSLESQRLLARLDPLQLRHDRGAVHPRLRDAEPLGQLHDLQAGVRVVSPLVLSAFVYRVEAPPPLTLNHEVQHAFWVPASTLTNPAHRVDHRFGPGRFPGILVGEPDRHVVWGLTYQLLGQLFALTQSDEALS